MQTIDANKPIWTPNQLNGQAHLAFDGTNDILDLGAAFVNGPVGNVAVSVVFVAKLYPAGSGLWCLVGSSALDGFGMYSNLSGANLVSFEFNGGNGYRPATTLTGYQGIIGTKGPGAINQTTHLYNTSGELTGGSHSTNTPNFVPTGWYENNTADIGAWAATPGVVDVVELFVHKTEYTAGQRADILSYLATRYGL